MAKPLESHEKVLGFVVCGFFCFFTILAPGLLIQTWSFLLQGEGGFSGCDSHITLPELLGKTMNSVLSKEHSNVAARVSPLLYLQATQKKFVYIDPGESDNNS